MTVPTTFVPLRYTGSGTTGPFSVPYQFGSATYLRVRKTVGTSTTTLTLTADYTVTGAGLPSGGNVTLTAPLAIGEVLEIDLGGALLTQAADYVNGGKVDFEDLEDSFDAGALADQWLQQQINRSIRAPDGSLPELPNVNARKGLYLRFNAGTGDPEAALLDVGALSGSALTAYPIVGDGSAVDFVLGEMPSSKNHVLITLSGTLQERSTYSLSGSTITFSEAPPEGVTGEILVIRALSLASAGDASAVAYQPSGTNAVERTVQDRLRDHAQAEDFGTLQQAVDTGRTVFFGPGTYSGSITLPASMALEADATADLTGLTFTGSLRKGNRFTFGGDYEATLGQLNHPQSPSGAAGTNVGNSWQNALTVVRGTATNPDTTALYARTAAYVEMHNDKVHTTNQSVWGGPYKVGALCVEHIAHANFEGAAHGGVFRAYSADPPASADDSKKNLVGMSAIGQTNPGAGNTCHNVWGANIIAAQTSGNTREACVGIEVDVLHTLDAVAGSGPTTGNNYTAYWAQSAASGVYSTAAFWASRSSGSLGWNYVLYSQTRARDWMAYLDNSETAVTTASGIYAKIASSAGTVMKLDSGANTQFQVGVDTANPVSVRVNSTLKTLEVGAADSAGAGYRQVRVTN